MFTGIIEEIGTVKNIRRGIVSASITFSADKVLKGTKVGDSIAVNGICLTVTSLADNSFTVDVMHETFLRTTLGNLTPGRSHVNLERAMPADGRFGGHIVSGHIDGTGEIKEIIKDDNAVVITVAAPPKIMHYIVEKGSVAIDGVSLTVAYADSGKFKVSLIPHTMKETILHEKRIGDRVNLECDIIGKYVGRMLGKSGDYSGIREVKDNKQETHITREFLSKNGF